MLIRSLRLHSFRSHVHTELTFTPKLNLLYGPNGAGKTNVLEAIHYLCLSKSFIASKDQHVLRLGSPFFEVEGHFEGERRRDLSVRLVYVPEEGKRVFINRSPVERLSDVVGLLPAVVFSPEDQVLTTGGPEERRRFMDNILSQARPAYLADLLSYRRALRQRNELLTRGRQPGKSSTLDGVLESWTEELIVLGVRLIAARQNFQAEFAPFLKQSFQALYPSEESPDLEYVTIARLPVPSREQDIAQGLRAKLQRVNLRERELGRTLAGPHLDELIFRLNSMEIRRYASQGQHRTFGMAMKLAKYFYLKERTGETPLLLLDDVFGSLDPERTAILLGLLESEAVGQSLITATHLAPFEGHIHFGGGSHQALEIRSGALALPTL
jgi:DNA replication and repair protein RecF